MEKDPCHELEMARAALAGLRERLSDLSMNDQLRKTLEVTASGLWSEIRWWRPRCDRELKMEKGDG